MTRPPKSPGVCSQEALHPHSALSTDAHLVCSLVGRSQHPVPVENTADLINSSHCPCPLSLLLKHGVDQASWTFLSAVAWRAYTLLPTGRIAVGSASPRSWESRTQPPSSAACSTDVTGFYMPASASEANFQEYASSLSSLFYDASTASDHSSPNSPVNIYTNLGSTGILFFVVEEPLNCLAGEPLLCLAKGPVFCVAHCEQRRLISGSTLTL